MQERVGGVDVLQVLRWWTPLYLARALVPPPRLRAERDAFSAPLQATQRAQGSGLEAGYGANKNLRFPALVGLLWAMWCALVRGGSRGRFSKRVISAIWGKTGSEGRAVRACEITKRGNFLVIKKVIFYKVLIYKAFLWPQYHLKKE